MRDDEKLIFNYYNNFIGNKITSLEYNDPPDFILNETIAIEATRLTRTDIEESRNALTNMAKSIASKLSNTNNNNYIQVKIMFKRALPNTLIVKGKIEKSYYKSILSELTYKIQNLSLEENFNYYRENYLFENLEIRVSIFENKTTPLGFSQFHHADRPVIDSIERINKIVELKNEKMITKYGTIEDINRQFSDKWLTLIDYTNLSWISENEKKEIKNKINKKMFDKIFIFKLSEKLELVSEL